MPLLEVKDLGMSFTLGHGFSSRSVLRAVHGVSFEIERGESVGLVGESGCGKTTLARGILRLMEPTEGNVLFDGHDVRAMKPRELRRFRQSAQIVFQDPYDSLNPRLTVGSMLDEVLRVHRIVPRADRPERVRELLRSVGLNPAYAARYPHEISGGQRQRIGIARALAVNPRFVIADEPVSALDVSVQVQILNLLKDLRQGLGLTYLFIAHDLAVVRYTCERVLVMYLGRIVESALTDELIRNPAHPYTRALLAAAPDIAKAFAARASGAPRTLLKGEIPSAGNEIPGCPFHPRCPECKPLCRTAAPPTAQVSRNHTAACHFADR